MGLSAKRKPSQQARLSPAFSSCLGVLWGEGRRPSPSLPPISSRMLQSVALHCSAALAPQGQSPPPAPHLFWLEAGSPPACTGQPCQVLESQGRWAGFHPRRLALACTQDFSASSGEWVQ